MNPTDTDLPMLAAELPALAASLPALAQKILDPAGPVALKQMVLKGAAPGLKPGDVLGVLVVLGGSADAEIATGARDALGKVPPPLLQGALGGALHPLVLLALAPRYATQVEVAEKILQHANVGIEAVIAMAKVASEPVCELLATNEERLLAHPVLIETLYKNRATRMSTVDRMIELAVRNDVEVNIPAFKEVAMAISEQLIPEPTAEPTFDDQAFSSFKHTEDELDEAVLDDLDLSLPADKRAKEEEADRRFEDLSITGRIRAVLTSAKPSIRMKGLRDASPLVRKAAVKSDSFTDAEAEVVTSHKNTYEDVLREIGNNPTLLRRHKVKVNLVMNPRTPVGIAQKFLPFLREHELKLVSGSKDVQGAIAEQAKQMLKRKGK
jgi:hypothetical protein